MSFRDSRSEGPLHDFSLRVGGPRHTDAVHTFEYSVEISRFGPDHVTVRRDFLRNLVTFHRDARDLESAWELDPHRWPAFLDRIRQPEAVSVLDGVRLAVEAGEGAEVLRAVSNLARLVFSEINWDVAHGE